MKDINACEELLMKFSDAMILAAYQQYYRDNENNYRTMNESKDATLFKNMIDLIVTKYVLPEVPEIDTVNHDFPCPYCQKKYKRRVGLFKHIQRKHTLERKKPSLTTGDDAILNYSRNSLTLTYLVKNFTDARKHGDGERIIRLYKYLLLYFKIDNRTKYAFQSLHLLAQVNDLLPPALAHELKWNRTVNHLGNVDSNIELDRELEHRNKYAKAELCHMQGKVTDRSIKRVSRSYQNIEDIIKDFDNDVNEERPSGRHTIPNWDTDVKELAEQYTTAGLLTYQPGRYHSRFPAFPKNCLTKINALGLTQWAYERIFKLSKLIYISNTRHLYKVKV